MQSQLETAPSRLGWDCFCRGTPLGHALCPDGPGYQATASDEPLQLKMLLLQGSCPDWEAESAMPSPPDSFLNRQICISLLQAPSTHASPAAAQRLSAKLTRIHLLSQKAPHVLSGSFKCSPLLYTEPQHLLPGWEQWPPSQPSFHPSSTQSISCAIASRSF